MRQNQTTYMRAIAQARKLQPAVRQINNSLFFSVASTSVLDGWHNVTLGPNKYNPLVDAKCDCGQNRFQCMHKAAAFLQYTSNLETRCENGSNYLHSEGITQEQYEAGETLFIDLLDRYTRCLDLLRAIEAGYDITSLTKPYRDQLFGSNFLLTA